MLDQEYRFSQGVILSETDLEGILTFVNHRFCLVTGYEKEELLGQDHNIIRHPDMPREIFRDLWKTIRRADPWEGIIKNLRRDGRYYWIHLHVEPRIIHGEMQGFLGVSRPADPDEIAEAKILHKELLIQEKARI